MAMLFGLAFTQALATKMAPLGYAYALCLHSLSYDNGTHFSSGSRMANHHADEMTCTVVYD
jgi:hypothetical protein